MEEKDGKRSKIDEIISNIIKLIYSKEKKIERYILSLTFIGFILRLIAALNLDVLADDMVHVSQSAGVFGAKILSTHSNPPLFYYLTDLAFKVFGYTTLASRFFPLVFGTLLIPLSYMISIKLFKNKNIGLLSAFFVTFSSFLIRNTFGEASLIVLFFSFAGVYFGLIYLEEKTYISIILSGIFFGLGILTKYNAPFFLLGFLVYSIVFLRLKKETIFTKKNIYSLIILLLIVFLFSLPFLTLNYLLYKDKGITDVYFSRVIQTSKTQEIYGGLAGQGNSFTNNLLNLNSYGNYTLPFYSDISILLFALLGFGYLFIRKQYSILSFLIIILIIPFIFQSAGAPLPKHFVFMFLLLSISAGYGLYNLLKSFNKKNINYIIILILAVLMLANIGTQYSTPANYLDKSPTSQLKSFINNNVNANNLIVFDNRIYTSRTFWLATPNNFVSFYDFSNLYTLNFQIDKQYKTPIDIYYVECAIDDCGWGTIKDQPELNKTMEDYFKQLSTQVQPIERINSYEYSGNELYGNKKPVEVYKIYKSTIDFSPALLSQAYRFNSFYFVPYMYEDMSGYVFSYEIKNLPDRLLNSLSYLIILLSVLLSIISIFILFYLFLKD